MTEATGRPDPPRRTIRVLAQRAHHALALAGGLVRTGSVPLAVSGERGRKWRLFLDQPEDGAVDSVETCAISCAITALAAAGEPVDSPLMDEAARTLLSLQSTSGGWTSWVSDVNDRDPEADPEEPLIIDTFFALTALNALEQDHEPFRRGIDWFRSAQDAATGGWGFYPGAEPQILPTSMAIVALCLTGPSPEPVIRDVIGRGVGWLLSRQSGSGEPGWSNRDGRPSSAVHTAWVLRALAAAGYDAYSPPVVAARDWLLENIHDRESIIDHYVTPGRTLRGRARATRAITHISFPEGIILHGLLRAGTDLLDPRLHEATEQLLSAQQADGHWHCLNAPWEQPIYAITDACLALHQLVNQVQRQEPVLLVSERVQHHEASVAALGDKVTELLAVSTRTGATLAELASSVADIRRRLDEQEQRWQRLSTRIDRTDTGVRQLRRGLAMLRPLMWLTDLVARWRLLSSLVLLQLVAYSLTAFAVPPEHRLQSLGAGVLLTIVAALTFWTQRRDTHTRPSVPQQSHAKDVTHEL